MTLLLRVCWAIITGLIFFMVGLAFLPHAIASMLAHTQKFLSSRIDRSIKGEKP